MIDFQTVITPDHIVTISVYGKLDESTCDYFFQCIDDLISEGYREIIIDCEGLGFISSYGWGLLVKSRRKSQKIAGRIHLAGVNSIVSEVIAFLRFDQLFGIFPTVESALAKVRTRTNNAGSISLIDAHGRPIPQAVSRS